MADGRMRKSHCFTICLDPEELDIIPFRRPPKYAKRLIQLSQEITEMGSARARYASREVASRGHRAR
jgi:hypothetical protein